MGPCLYTQRPAGFQSPHGVSKRIAIRTIMEPSSQPLNHDDVTGT